MSLDVSDIDSGLFWSFVNCGDEDSCWLWKGSFYKHGYGRYNQNGNQYYAHCIAWLLSHGSNLPSGLVHRHTCDTPSCCNPRHIISGTQADNVRDMFARNRRVNTVRGERHPKAKLTTQQVIEMRIAYANGERIATMARKYGVSFWCIEAVVKRKHWKAVK